MNRLEELIEKLCPDGVEYISLKNTDIFSFRYGKGNKIPVDTGGIYDVYGANGVVSHINEYNCEDVSIIGHIGAVGLVNRCKGKCFVTYNGTIAQVVDKNKVNTQYLYYVLTTLDLPSYKKGSQPFLSVSDFENVKIPVPPLEVQSEIVRILDNFTELTAELTARKKQYEYYRDELFTFTDSVEYKALGEVCKLVTGATPSKSKSEYWKGGVIPWMSSGEVNQKRVFYTENKITQYGYDNASTTLVPIHTVVIALAGQGKTRGKVAITEIELCTNQSLCSMICNDKKINYKYLYYYLDSKYDDLRAISNGDGTRGGLSLRILNPYTIPVPPLGEQQRIVDILDRFDKLCNDISEGLPAEIEARQKQYEYYRDKLLSFKSLSLNS